MKHSVKIKVINSPTGVPSPEDGIALIIIQAVAVNGTFALGTVYPLQGLDDLAALGIDEDYDVTNSTAVYQQVTEFYAEAGDGALLWLQGVATNTAFATYVASQAFEDALQFTSQADPTQRAKLIGLCYALPATVQSATDFPADVLATIPAFQAAQENMFNLGYQFAGVLDGYNMSNTVTSAGIGTMATQGAPAVCLNITGTKGNGVSSVGLFLGRCARISIGHGVGAVTDGPRPTATAFLTNGIAILPGQNVTTNDVYLVVGGTIVYNGVTYGAGKTFSAVAGHATFTTPDTGYAVFDSTPVQSLRPADIDNYGEKQFLFLRTWRNHSGFYWNDGATCDDPTDTLSTIEYNRVANSLSADALDTFIDEMGQNELLDTSTGAVASSILRGIEGRFDTEYITPLVNSGDISGGELILTAPDFNSTRTINFKIKVVPTPIMGDADGTLEFDATL